MMEQFDKINDTDNLLDPPKCEFTFNLIDLFSLLLIMFSLGAGAASLCLIKYTEKQVHDSDVALTSALQHEKEAITLTNQYRFTLEKVGAIMAKRCNKENSK